MAYAPQLVAANPQYAPVPQAEPLVLLGQQMENRPLLNGIIAHRPGFAHVEIALQAGEKVMANGRTMNWMDGNIKLDPQIGDCCAAYYRSCSGNSLCLNHFSGPGPVAFGSDLPGDILPFGVTPGNGWVVAPYGFLCGTDNLEVSSRFTGCLACVCNLEAPFLTKITSNNGNGMFYACGYGAITRHDVPEGKSLFVDNGLFFASNQTIDIGLGCPGNIISWCYGGEGLVMKFQGPCVVYTTNRNSAAWRRVLNAPPPRQRRTRRRGALLALAQ